MMSAEVGFIPYVTGMSNAIVAEGPMPGSTPMTVPRKHPINVYQRLIGCRQTTNTLRMCVIVSIGFLELQDALGQIHVERHEQPVSEDRKQNRGQYVRDPLAAVEPCHQWKQEDASGYDIACPVEHDVVEPCPYGHAAEHLQDIRIEGGCIGRLRGICLTGPTHLQTKHTRSNQQGDAEQTGKRLRSQRI